MNNHRVDKVIDLDPRPDQGMVEVDNPVGDVGGSDLDALLVDVDVLVHLVSAGESWFDGSPVGAGYGCTTRRWGRRSMPGPTPVGAGDGCTTRRWGRRSMPGPTPVGAGDGCTTRRLLEAAGSAGVGRIVLMSTAMVYGAWPDNPVPLTEASLLRPVPGFDFAIDKAEQERYVAQWAEDHPAVDVVTLRPTTTLAEEHVGWVAQSLRSAVNLAGESEVPVQFLHLEDLAAAVELAVVGDLTGVYNVAPEGWISSGTILEFEGLTPRVRLPEQLLGRPGSWWWRHRLVPTSPGVFQYARFSWVVGSDRLRAAGWTPEYTSDLAYVSGHEGRRWGMLDSRRRQQIALGGAVVGGLALVWGLLAAARRLLR